MRDYQIALDAEDSQHRSARVSKVGATLIGGACLVVLSMVAITSPSTVAEVTNLASMPTSVRANSMKSMGLAPIPGPSPWKELAIEAINANNRCDRDVSIQALPSFSKLTRRDMTVLATGVEKMKAMAGEVPPLNYFDPWGLSTDSPLGTLNFYREAELKHGRTCMLAFLGIVVGEKFHPFTGGEPVNLPGGIPVEWTPLPTFFLAIVMTFVHSVELNQGTRMRDLIEEKKDVVPGDLGFDPLGLKAKNEQAYMETQNKEISNGRLAMLAVAGIVGQELATGQKVFG